MRRAAFGGRQRRNSFSRLTPRAARLLRTARVAHFATADANGRPHVVPICFAVDGRELFTPLDEKPKSAALLRLKRVRNIRANPAVAVIVDHYEENWRRLAYVLLQGRATLVARGKRHRKGVRLLRKKYAQYRKMRLEGRPVIVIRCNVTKSWGADSAK